MLVMMSVSTQTLFVVHGTCNAPKRHCHPLISSMTYYSNTSCKTIKFNFLLGKVHIFFGQMELRITSSNKIVEYCPIPIFVSTTFNRIETKICKVKHAFNMLSEETKRKKMQGQIYV
jgi:hypothetical protein